MRTKVKYIVEVKDAEKELLEICNIVNSLRNATKFWEENYGKDAKNAKKNWEEKADRWLAEHIKKQDA